MTQSPSLLLGSADDIMSLAQRKSARLLAISDSHGGRIAFSAIVRTAVAEKMCDALVFCGDGVADLLFCCENIGAQKMPPVTAFVAGNNDFGRYAVSVPVEQTFVACGKKIFVTHGHRYNVYRSTDLLLQAAVAQKADISFYGHTHIADETNEKGIYLINPGSIYQPRSYLPPSFAIVSICDEQISTEFYKFEIKNGTAVFGRL